MGFEIGKLGGQRHREEIVAKRAAKGVAAEARAGLGLELVFALLEFGGGDLDGGVNVLNGRKRGEQGV